MIRAIIVEDDQMVAHINQQYLEKIGGIRVDGIFLNGKDALEYLRVVHTDLVILDVYMPMIDGMDVLRKMRAEGINSSVIMVTAANDVDIVIEALNLGIVDYLIKPFTFERFGEAMEKYIRKVRVQNERTNLDQRALDKLIYSEKTFDTGNSSPLPKGLHTKTLDYLFEVIKNATGAEHTCSSLSEEVGLSKVTVRRYLNYMSETGMIKSSIDYDTGGRPRVLYRYNKHAG